MLNINTLHLVMGLVSACLLHSFKVATLSLVYFPFSHLSFIVKFDVRTCST